MSIFVGNFTCFVNSFFTFYCHENCTRLTFVILQKRVKEMETVGLTHCVFREVCQLFVALISSIVHIIQNWLSLNFFYSQIIPRADWILIVLILWIFVKNEKYHGEYHLNVNFSFFWLRTYFWSHVNVVNIISVQHMKMFAPVCWNLSRKNY